ncbi:MAG: short-chain dehydrogenase [Rhodospirillaceae bacterium]|nr:short-chain dehydrogenase [Rhodospirillaceae bacterium]MDP6624267.1 SDR family oxidoreductase [Alphaproteobacteria bacterium]
MFQMTDKVAVITGSTKGIGRAIAERYAEFGAKVVISSRKADKCEEVAAGIREKGGQAMAIPCHIRHKEQLQNLIDETNAAWGSIDVLVCNAAVNPHFGPLADIPDDALDRTLECNIRSNIWICNMVYPQMAEKGSGSVIIVSSVGGYRGDGALAAYCISKAADFQVARSLAVEWGPANVRINCIAPGLVRTDFARALWENPEIYERTVRNAPLRRIAEPDEIAGAAVYLASDSAGFMTGQTMVIDGGATIAAPRP